MTNEMTVPGILREARAQVATPERWVKGAALHVRDDGTKQQCAMQAVSTAYYRLLTPKELESQHMNLFWAALDTMRRAIPHHEFYPGITAYNDAPERTHDEILALFDAAIAAEEQPASREHSAFERKTDHLEGSQS